MVFGNMGNDSGTGVAFTRDPNTGEQVLFGEYLINAQGEDVVAGIRTAAEDRQMQTEMPEVYGEFVRIGELLEKHYRDVQDLEFTIERGKLYMLQTRSAKRTAAAAVKIASTSSPRASSTRKRRSSDRAGACRPAPPRPVRPDGASERRRASPRASTPRRARRSGGPSSTPTRAVEWVGRGERVVLVRIETSPDDFHGMAVAQGILTARGGATATRRSSRARSASPASPAATSWSSTTAPRPPRPTA